MAIDQKYWHDNRWDGHAAFNTTDHRHISCYFPAPGHASCEVSVVACAGGRWFVEDSWGGDASGAEGVWNPFDSSDADPLFFETEEAAIAHAVKVVARIGGVPEEKVSTT